MSLLIDYCQQCLFPLQSPTDAIFFPSLFPIVKSWTLIFTKASETCRTLDISLKSRRCFLAVILVSPIHSWKGSPLLSVLCLCGLWLSLWFAGASQLRVLLFEILCPTSCCQTSTSWLEKLNSAFQNKKTFFSHFVPNLEGIFSLKCNNDFTVCVKTYTFFRYVTGVVTLSACCSCSALWHWRTCRATRVKGFIFVFISALRHTSSNGTELAYNGFKIHAASYRWWK